MAILINGERIEDFVIEQESEHLRPEYERTFADMDKDKREKQLMEWSRENVIERVLINQEAAAKIDTVTGEDVDAAFEQLKSQQADKGAALDEKTTEKVKQGIASGLRVERLLEQVAGDVDQPNEEQIEKFYSDNKEKFTEEAQVHVGHIVKHINWQSDEKTALEQIQKTKQQIDGGTPFEQAATASSDCPDQGGDLGFIKKGQMVEEFEDVAFNLGTDQVSDIINTRYGYHIVKCYERKDAVAHSLDEDKVRKVVIE
ncbi:MAG: peptidylprolyl isomerase, partial [Phycisphaerae bacterium]|nr:peptidylprolyl isomerase [Phycisphaerae bacterium]